MADIRHNDEVIAFLAANGYATEYNDGLLAYLRDFYGVTTFSLNDLLRRYLDDFGSYELQPMGFILLENGDFILQENNDRILL